ncbi:MAG: peptide chain release factor 1 [Parcubacteria group bacterium]|nr:peptide chain release factor 1 [Parcubacteria group bacterium]
MDLTKLEALLDEYAKLEKELADPTRTRDPVKLTKLAKRKSELTDVALSGKRLLALGRDLREAEGLLRESDDPELKKLAQEEVSALKGERTKLESYLASALVAKDPRDEKNAILEIRAGAGGDEASLFAAEILRMEMRFAERKGLTAEIVSENRTGLAGYKEVVARIIGKGAYGVFRYEGGVHRVQRIPDTEKSGRIHTSTVTVAVLPEVSETELTINPSDIRIDTMTSGGHGGQSVNTTYSAVRIVHLPTGLIVQSQDERSQLQNKEKAMRVLRARLAARAEEERSSKEGNLRKSQVGSAERAEKIRTYNFPQNRVTDHRVKLTTHNLSAVLDGELDELTNAVRLGDQAALEERKAVRDQ